MSHSVIKEVSAHSALQGKAHPGDRLLSINGNVIHDVLDYMYYSYDSNLIVELESPEGDMRKIHGRKPNGQEWVLDFED